MNPFNFKKLLKANRKHKDSKENLLAKDGFKILKDENQEYWNQPTFGMSIDEMFEQLKTKSLQEVLIKDGFKCLNNLYVDDINYDMEGRSTLSINKEFLSLDHDLTGLEDLKINPKKNKISLNNTSYNLKTLRHIFGGNGDYDKPETGMIYLKVVNHYLNSNGIKKIAYIITDTKLSEFIGLCISDNMHFEKVQCLFKYIENLNENNRNKVIQLAKDETSEIRGFDLLTNYKGYLIDEGIMVHVVE